MLEKQVMGPPTGSRPRSQLRAVLFERALPRELREPWQAPSEPSRIWPVGREKVHFPEAPGGRWEHAWRSAVTHSSSP